MPRICPSDETEMSAYALFWFLSSDSANSLVSGGEIAGVFTGVFTAVPTGVDAVVPTGVDAVVSLESLLISTVVGAGVVTVVSAVADAGVSTVVFNLSSSFASLSWRAAFSRTRRRTSRILTFGVGSICSADSFGLATGFSQRL